MIVVRMTHDRQVRRLYYTDLKPWDDDYIAGIRTAGKTRTSVIRQGMPSGAHHSG